MISTGVPIFEKRVEFEQNFGALRWWRCLRRHICRAALPARRGPVAVFGEVVALLDLVGAFFAGQRRLVAGDVADQVEVAVVPADFLREVFQHDAVFFQFLDNGLLLLGAVPALQEIVQRGEFGPRSACG